MGESEKGNLVHSTKASQGHLSGINGLAILAQILLTDIDPPYKYVAPADATKVLEEPLKNFYDESLPQQERQAAGIEGALCASTG